MEMTQVRQKGKALCIAVLVAMLCMALPPVRAYAADNPLVLTVSQVFDNTSTTVTNDEFTYRLVPDAPGNPMPAGSTADGYTFTITGTASKLLPPIQYNNAGLYYYTIAQVVTTEEGGYTYDRHVYDLVVQVDFYLDLSFVVYDMTREKAASIQFKNEFRVTPTDPDFMLDAPVIKTVTGSPSQASPFIFWLEAQNASQPMPAGSVGGVKEITITGSGTARFGNWVYDEEGVYYYTVYERNTGVTGYTYDTERYTIVDTVVAIDGDLVLSRVITNSSNRQVTSYSFINPYTSAAPGPKTGDMLNTSLYIGLLVTGCAAAVGALLFLSAGTRRKEAEL